MLEASSRLLFLLVWALPSLAEAQLLPSFDGYAEAIIIGSAGKWTGQRVPWPSEHARPGLPSSLAAADLPLRVHADEDATLETLERALAGARAMHALMQRLGFPPLGQDTLGPDGDFDLYLVPEPEVETWQARSDGPATLRPLGLDTAETHAIVASTLRGARLEACAAEAYAGARLLALDPAEAASWRRATATYLGYFATGSFEGCTDDVARAQAEPGTTWVGYEEGAQGALLLALLADRHDGGSGAFVRELWNMARQRTWEGEGLRGSPDLWEALRRTLELVGLDVDDTLVDLAIARASASVVGTRARLELPTSRAMDGTLHARIGHRITMADLPEHLPISEPIAPLGSLYVHLDARDAPRDTRVRVWLRAERATRWSLALVGFDAEGREVARVRAPPTERETNAYVPYELEASVRDILVVVTNLGELPVDADLPDEPPHACRVVVGLARSDEVSGAL